MKRITVVGLFTIASALILIGTSNGGPFRRSRSAPAAPTQDASGGCDCSQGAADPRTTTVCPKMIMMNHVGYCDFYSLSCDAGGQQTPCMWQGACNTSTLPSCPGPCQSALRGNDEGHYVQPGIKLTTLPSWDNMARQHTIDTVGAGGRVTWLATYHITYRLKKASEPLVHAQVYLFELTPADATRPPAIIAMGNEITDPGATVPVNFDVTKKAVAKMGNHRNCHQVTIGAIAFQVITNTDDD